MTSLANFFSITIHDSVYPESLRAIYKPPQTLYCRGNIELLKYPKFAIVGTRKASDWGLRHAKEMSREIARNGLVIVSGLAYGIDAAAHEASLETGHTIAVLAHGIQKVQPRFHEALVEKILAKGGLILSENEAQSPVMALEYLNRNRIIAGLSQGILLVEAPHKSGAMNTVAHARQEDRDVFCIPVKPEDHAQGNLQCLKQFGMPVCNPKDILDYYHIKPKIDLKKIRDPILQTLQNGPLYFEDFLKKNPLQETMLRERLFKLELEGLIRINLQQAYELS